MSLPNHLVQKIVSGGQTGVDRAALDVAISLGIPHGGWCPKGRRSESGPIDGRYQLLETEEWDYSVRTEKNVVDSDGTLIFHRGLPITSGTKLTFRMANKHKRPVLKFDLSSHQTAIMIPAVQDWIKQQGVCILNVAGPRDSTSPGIGKQVRDVLVELLSVVPVDKKTE